MKKLLLLAVVVFGIAATAQAQCAGKSGDTAAASCCSKGKTSTAALVTEPVQVIGADIEQRSNAAGEVSYVRKVVDTNSGAVSYKDVEYCTKTNQFVDVDASVASQSKKANCADDAKAGCCSKSGAEASEPAAKGKAKGKRA
jgi:DNA replication initiation complex subunit (GINS family)